MRVHTMSAGVIVALALLGAAACSSPSSSTPAPTGALGAPASTTTTAPPFPVLSVTPTTISPPSKVGATVALPGTDRSAPELVTLLGIIDPATGSDQFSTPVAGGRFVGVQIRITIGGTTSTREDPFADTIVTDSQGNVYTPTSANIKTCATIKAARVVAAGKSLTGCLTFQLESDTLISDVTFTPGGTQFGSVSADWRP